MLTKRPASTLYLPLDLDSFRIAFSQLRETIMPSDSLGSGLQWMLWSARGWRMVLSEVWLSY